MDIEMKIKQIKYKIGLLVYANCFGKVCSGLRFSTVKACIKNAN